MNSKLMIDLHKYSYIYKTAKVCKDIHKQHEQQVCNSTSFTVIVLFFFCQQLTNISFPSTAMSPINLYKLLAFVLKYCAGHILAKAVQLLPAPEHIHHK